MQITFRPKEGNRDRWEILIEGEKWREVHRAIFGRNPTFPPSSEQNLHFHFDTLEHRRVKSYVLWRLSVQSYHSEHLKMLLRERLVQTHTIERVLQEFKEMGFLDDESWLQIFMRAQQKRYGLRSILSKLHKKGLSSLTLQRIEKEWKNPEEEIHTIQDLLKTRYRHKDLTQYKIKHQVIAALARKGYSFEQIQKAMQQLSLENE